MAALPDNGNACTRINSQGETLYTCNDVLYRPTYYQDDQVYEVVSSDADTPKPASPIAQASNDTDVELQLESPYLRGDRVRTLQNALVAIGFDVGGKVDGVFGGGTDQAVRDFQDWYGLPVTGVVDAETVDGIVAEYTALLSPPREAALENPQNAPADAGQDMQGDDQQTAAPPASGDGSATTPVEEPAAAAVAPASGDAPAEGVMDDAGSEDGATGTE